MKPIDIRDDNWARIRDNLSDLQLEVHELYRRFGPCTTRELADFAPHISLFTIRPRTTELLQLGLITFVNRKDAQGIYAAVSMEDAERNFQERVRTARQTAQLDLFSESP